MMLPSWQAGGGGGGGLDDVVGAAELRAIEELVGGADVVAGTEDDVSWTSEEVLGIVEEELEAAGEVELRISDEVTKNVENVDGSADDDSENLLEATDELLSITDDEDGSVDE